MRRALSLALLVLAACAGPRASIEIEEVRVTRDPDNKVIAEIDLLAHDQLGGNIGRYCAQVTFPGESVVETCGADLEDGDRRTVRFVSLGAPGPGALVNVRVRLGNIDEQRSHAAP